MTTHDLKRMMILKKTMERAKVLAETATLYLNPEQDREQLWDLHLVGEHIDNAIERLAAAGKVTECPEMLPAISTS